MNGQNQSKYLIVVILCLVSIGLGCIFLAGDPALKSLILVIAAAAFVAIPIKYLRSESRSITD